MFLQDSSTGHKTILARVEAVTKMKCTYQQGDVIYRRNGFHILNSEHLDGIQVTSCP